jgi:hypothetical protein
VALAALGLAGCESHQTPETPAESADEFVARVNRALGDLQK